MNEFFKRIGIGIVVIISSPLWLAYFLVYVLFGTLAILFAPIRLLIALITKEKFTVKSEYDAKAEAILKGGVVPPAGSVPASQPNAFPVNQPTMSQTGIPNPNYQPNQVPYNGGYPANYPPQNANPYPPNAYPQPNPFHEANYANGQNPNGTYNPNYPNNGNFNNPNGGQGGAN